MQCLASDVQQSISDIYVHPWTNNSVNHYIFQKVILYWMISQQLRRTSTGFMSVRGQLNTVTLRVVTSYLLKTVFHLSVMWNKFSLRCQGWSVVVPYSAVWLQGNLVLCLYSCISGPLLVPNMRNIYSWGYHCREPVVPKIHESEPIVSSDCALQNSLSVNQEYVLCWAKS